MRLIFFVSTLFFFSFSSFANPAKEKTLLGCLKDEANQLYKLSQERKYSLNGPLSNLNEQFISDISDIEQICFI